VTRLRPLERLSSARSQLRDGFRFADVPLLPLIYAPSLKDKEIRYKKRLDLTYKAWIIAEGNKLLNVKNTARIYRVKSSTLRRRVYRAVSTDDR